MTNESSSTDHINKQPTVLLIDADSSRKSLLKRGLNEFNFKIIAIKDNALNLVDDVITYQPDILVVGIDLPDQDTLNHIANLQKDMPRPVVMFAEKDTPQIIQQTVSCGINAFIVDVFSL